MLRRDVDMTNGALLPNIVRFTVPIILTSVLQLLFNAADLVVVGRFGGSSSVGAVGATGSLINLIVNLFIGLAIGAGVAVANARGANDGERLFRVVHTGLPTALIGGVILTFAGIFLSKPILGLMGTHEDIIDLSVLYLRIYFLGAVPMLVYNFGASILRAVGDSRRPLIFLSVSGVINVLLNLFFVIVLKMDVAGVALATTISQTLSASLIVAALMKREDESRLFLSKMKIYKDQLVYILKVGMPAGLQGCLFSISNVLIQSAVNSFNSVAVVSGGAAAKSIEGFVYVIQNSFAQTAVNFVGQNMGARKYDRVGKTFRVCLACATVAGLFFGVGIYLLGRPLLGIYLKDSPEAIEYGLIKMRCICMPYFICAYMDVATGVLRGMGKSFAPMLMTVVGACLSRIAWIYTVFQIHHTLLWLYGFYPVSWGLTFIAEFIFYLIVKKKTFGKEVLKANA